MTPPPSFAILNSRFNFSKKHGVVKIKLIPILIILFLFLLPLPCKAEDFKIQAEKDTWTDSNYPETNFGAEQRIITGFTTSSRILFLQFNLDNLPEIKEDQDVLLNLYLEQGEGDLIPINLEILLPSSEWDENTLTWNNKPSLYQSGLSVSLEATPGAQLIPLTPLVKQWLGQEVKNTGLAFYYNHGVFERTYFSREHDKYPPSLIIKNKEEKKPEAFPLEMENRTKFLPQEAPQQIERLAQAKTEKAKQAVQVLGEKTMKFIHPKNLLNKNTLLPLVILWTSSVFLLLLKII